MDMVLPRTLNNVLYSNKTLPDVRLNHPLTMAFQIHTASGEAMTLNNLDKEAAEFWEVEIDPQFYAGPQQSMSNWFDEIGWAISEGASSWELVRQRLAPSGEALAGLIAKDMIRRVNHWEAKGYKPVQLSDY